MTGIGGRAELGWIRDGGCQRARSEQTHAGHGGDALREIVRSVPGQQVSFELVDTLLRFDRLLGHGMAADDGAAGKPHLPASGSSAGTIAETQSAAPTLWARIWANSSEAMKPPPSRRGGLVRLPWSNPVDQAQPTTSICRHRNSRRSSRIDSNQPWQSLSSTGSILAILPWRYDLGLFNLDDPSIMCVNFQTTDRHPVALVEPRL